MLVPTKISNPTLIATLQACTQPRFGKSCVIRLLKPFNPLNLLNPLNPLKPLPYPYPYPTLTFYPYLHPHRFVQALSPSTAFCAQPFSNSLLQTALNPKALVPVSYTHLTLPTIYSV